MKTAQSGVRTEEIARRAYELWEARGRPPSDGTEDWEAAFAELTSARFKNGAVEGGFRAWWSRVRQKITGRDA